jgi:solute carrier family 10 (sodium/bile acid cotransporter), member 7
MRWKPDWFLVGMICAAALAWLAPGLGAKDGPLHPDLVNKLGVAVIFFLNGAGLSFAALKAGAFRWQLHLVVQTATYLLFPLLGLALLKLTGSFITPVLALGFFFLCALPSTVSSSVALTSAARGNVPAAVFNATLSSVIGIFLTPLWVGWMLNTQGPATFSLGKVILDLVLWLILPLVLGQLSRPLTAAWIKAHKPFVQFVDRGTILFIIFTSLCDSILRGVWSGQGVWTVATALAGGLILFFIIFAVVGAICNALKFPVEDRITAVFCGSKKTIASGVPMAQLIFAGDPRLGLILLPLMIYHPMQLVICGVLANRWSRRPGEVPESPQ